MSHQEKETVLHTIEINDSAAPPTGRPEFFVEGTHDGRLFGGTVVYEIGGGEPDHEFSGGPDEDDDAFLPFLEAIGNQIETSDAYRQAEQAYQDQQA